MKYCGNGMASSLARVALLAGLFVGLGQAVLVRVSFEGAWRVSSGELAADAPFAGGDRITGYLIFDADAPSKPSGLQGANRLFDDAIRYVSLTFDGLGTVTWDPTRVSPGRSFPASGSIQTIANSFGTEVGFQVADSSGNPPVESAWQGAPGLLQFPSSLQGAAAPWRLSTFRTGFVVPSPQPVDVLPTAGSTFRSPPYFDSYFKTQFNSNGQLFTASWLLTGRMTRTWLTAVKPQEAWTDLATFIDGQWFIDGNHDFSFDLASETSGWGFPGAKPVRADWNGDGFDELAVFADGAWFIDFDGDRAFDGDAEVKGWGQAGWTPMPGDWNGDGVIDLGVVAPDLTWFLDLNGDFAFDPVTPDFRFDRRLLTI